MSINLTLVGDVVECIIAILLDIFLRLWVISYCYWKLIVLCDIVFWIVLTSSVEFSEVFLEMCCDLQHSFVEQFLPRSSQSTNY